MLRIADEPGLMTGGQLQDILKDMPEWRREKVLRIKNPSQQRESAMAYKLLQEMLSEHYGIREPLAFDIGEHGKPSLAGHEDIHFNLSHCRRAVACVVDSHPVGVDIECLGRYKRPVAEHTMSEKELSEIAEGDADLVFTVLWTKKEALMKLIGTGISDDKKTILDTYDGKVVFDTIVCRQAGYVCTHAHWL